MCTVTLLLSLVAIVSCNPLGTPVLDCQEIDIPITASAQNKQLPRSLNVQGLSQPGALNSLLATSGSVVSGGEFTIRARFCTPLIQNNTRARTLQVLVHGITYTRDYWTGLAPPNTNKWHDHYSWVLYAASQGYHTLSVDRLCNGASSKPDGLTVCQLPLQSEVMYTVTEAARAGMIPGVKTSFNNIIYVGHSYGSLVGNDLSIRHPQAVDTYIMTGWTSKVANNAPAIVVLPGYQPAALALPTRYSNYLLDPAYLAATSLEGSEAEFYYDDYDPVVLQHDYNTQVLLR